ncbi:hypothetical protein KA005_27520, partial [bacterium]|nr:hypothetical protein [bacterium]
CVREEFPYIQKLCKDYRLEAKWEENAAKCFGTFWVSCAANILTRKAAADLRVYYTLWLCDITYTFKRLLTNR